MRKTSIDGTRHYERVHANLVDEVLEYQRTGSDKAFQVVSKELKDLIYHNVNFLPTHQRDDGESLLLLAAWRAVKMVDVHPGDEPEKVIKLVASVLKRARIHMLNGFSHVGTVDRSFKNEFPGYKLSLVGTELGDTDAPGGVFSEQRLDDEHESQTIDRLTMDIAVKQAMEQSSYKESDFDKRVLELSQRGHDAGEIAQIMDCTYFRVRNAKARLQKNAELLNLISH